jgi:hypothetical protein
MSERLYALLLKLYPRSFRARYEDEMLRDLRERLRYEGARRVWLDILGDAIESVPRQHLLCAPHPYYPESAAPLRAANATRILTFGLTVFVGAVTSVLLVMWIVLSVTGQVPAATPAATMTTAALLLIPWAIVLRGVCRVNRTIATYSAEAGNDSVTVFFEGARLLTVQRQEVIRLSDLAGLGLRIETADASRDLWIPAGTASYAEVKRRVSQWAPMTVTVLLALDQWAHVLRLALITVFVPVVPMWLRWPFLALILGHAGFALIRRKQPMLTAMMTFVAVAFLLARWLIVGR